jgi:hypothetical protein
MKYRENKLQEILDKALKTGGGLNQILKIGVMVLIF